MRRKYDFGVVLLLNSLWYIYTIKYTLPFRECFDNGAKKKQSRDCF